jgi:hypothetical protein
VLHQIISDDATLSVVTGAGFTIVILGQSNNLPNGKSKLTKTEKGETGEELSQEHVHHFL